MLCHRCGSQVPEGKTVCDNCGQELKGEKNLRPSLKLRRRRKTTQIHALPFQIGDVLASKYKIHDLIGVGILGAVYKVSDEKNPDKLLALKIIRPEYLISEEVIKSLSSIIRRIQNFSHKNIVRIYEEGFDRERNIFYYTMPYLEGLNLAKIIDLKRKKGQFFNLQELEPIIYDIADALEYAHTTMHHGYLKPQSIIIPPASLKITDFGIAQAIPIELILKAHSSDTKSLAYLAPEVKEGKKVDARADIFSLGIIFGEMLTGERSPDQIPAIHQINPEINPLADIIYRKATAKNPDERYQHIAEFVDDLISLIQRGELADDEEQPTQIVDDEYSEYYELNDSPEAERSPSGEAAGAPPEEVIEPPPDLFISPSQEDLSGSETKPEGVPAPTPKSREGLDSHLSTQPSGAELATQPAEFQGEGAPTQPAEFQGDAPTQPAEFQGESAPTQPAEFYSGDFNNSGVQHQPEGNGGVLPPSPFAQPPAPAPRYSISSYPDSAPTLPARPAPVRPGANRGREFPSTPPPAVGPDPGAPTIPEPLPPVDFGATQPLSSDNLLTVGEEEESREGFSKFGIFFFILGLILMISAGGIALYFKFVYLPKTRQIAQVSPIAPEKDGYKTLSPVEIKEQNSKGEKNRKEIDLPVPKLEEGDAGDAEVPEKPADKEVKPREKEDRGKSAVGKEKDVNKSKTGEEKISAVGSKGKEREGRLNRKKAEKREAAGEKRTEKKREKRTVTAAAKKEKKSSDSREKILSFVTGGKKRGRRCPAGMVYIPAGRFLFGSAPDDPLRSFGEKRLTPIRVKAYCIDRYEYPGRMRRPKTNVSFYQAQKICRSLGKRLCTEYEWEKACKGRANFRFPYGNSFDPNRCNTRAGSRNRKVTLSGKFKGCRSPYGVYDMSGNVAEWTSSPFRPGSRNKTIRGGAANRPDWDVRCASRGSLPPNRKKSTVGFRCCADPLK